MRTIVITLLCICLCAGANAQIKNELKRQKLKGKVTLITEYEYDAANDSLKWKGVTKYNAAGDPVFFSTFSPTNDTLSKTTFTYNDSGIIKEERRYKADGSLNVRTTYLLDAKGNKIEEDNYDSGETMFMKVLSKYDGKGNRIVKDSYNEFGILFLKCNSKFNEDGMETESKEYDSHHSLKFSTSYDYGRHKDQAGNWKERTTYKNDMPSVITKREIEY